MSTRASIFKCLSGVLLCGMAAACSAILGGEEPLLNLDGSVAGSADGSTVDGSRGHEGGTGGGDDGAAQGVQQPGVDGSNPSDDGSALFDANAPYDGGAPHDGSISLPPLDGGTAVTCNAPHGAQCAGASAIVTCVDGQFCCEGNGIGTCMPVGSTCANTAICCGALSCGGTAVCCYLAASKLAACVASQDECSARAGERVCGFGMPQICSKFCTTVSPPAPLMTCQ